VAWVTNAAQAQAEAKVARQKGIWPGAVTVCARRRPEVRDVAVYTGCLTATTCVDVAIDMLKLERSIAGRPRE